MDTGFATLAGYGIGATAAVLALLALRTRLELSLAKHPSLAGHARMSRRIAALIPFYEYDEARVFRCDDPPEEIAARRRAGFMRLAALYRERFAKTLKGTDEVADGVSDMQFTGAYRVPF